MKNTGNAFIPTDYKRTFWNESEAVAFGEKLEANSDAENVSLSQAADPYNRRRVIYIVKWDDAEEKIK